jgi:hypothetical protein
VWCLGEGAEHETGGDVTTDVPGGSRLGDHLFRVEVYYSSDKKWQELQRLLLIDRHDLIKALSNSDDYNGINAANPSTATSMHSRTLESSEIDYDNIEQGWVTLHQEWLCTLNESEA